MPGVLLHEYTAAKNWPSSMRPDWADTSTRIYTGITINTAGQKWDKLLTVYDGTTTTVYLTQLGFDVERHGPALHSLEGATACHRKVIREFMREQYEMEVDFA